MRASQDFGTRWSMRMSLGAAMVLAASFAGSAGSQSSARFELQRARIAAGGGEAAGTNAYMRLTLGQHDAGYASGPRFEVRNGFWFVAAPSQGGAAGIFVDGFEDP